MTELERIVDILTEAMAQTAEQCAASLEATQSTLSGAQALRNFAQAIRQTDHLKAARGNAPLH